MGAHGWGRPCYHGPVSVASALGRGLPTGVAVGPEHQVQPRPARILLAEDDPLLQELFGAALASQGYEVETASDGLNALCRVREGRYDLVICDYKIPELNGLAMARLIRDLAGTAARPALIALTATPAPLVNEALPEGVFDEVVAKPVPLDELLLIVGRHLDARSAAATQGNAGCGDLEDQASGDAAPGPASREESQPSPPRILVVEDDDVQRSALRFVLEVSGYVVEAAVDGHGAVRLLRDGAFDLALIDFQLPGLDGLATGRLIRKLVHEDACPRLIAFTSAPSHLANRLAGADAVFDEVVAKSAGLLALLAAMERHLQSSPRATARRAAAAVFPSAA